MRERAIARLKMEADLEQAIRSCDLVLHYQPEIDLATRTIAGFEALVRWHHPERGMISPGEFIPQAEESGLILPLGDWGLMEACRQMAVWKRLPAIGPQPLRVSVNLSARQFGRPGLAGLHMDDFGTGYSSLNHLHQYPFRHAEDRPVLHSGIAEEQDSIEIVGTILDLARSLEMDVVAKGIETAEQAERLRVLGCPLGQGYYFSRPMDAAPIGAMLGAAGQTGCRLPEIGRTN